MVAKLRELMDRHEELREKYKTLKNKIEIHEAEDLLGNIRTTGKLVHDPVKRRILTNISRDIAEIIFDITGHYPSIRLATPVLNDTKDSIAFHPKKIELPPMQLPKRAEHFTDREMELQKLLTDLRPGHIITLCGPGGTGKSALAAEVLWKLVPDNKPPQSFPDGIIWHDFYREPITDQALEHIALSFGEEPKPTPLDAAKRALSGRQALLLLDASEEAEDLHKVLSIIGDCGALVTSRTRDDAGEDQRDIQSLELTEAIKLLQAWGREYAADKTSVSQICKLVDGLPLAVRLVGHYLNTNQESAAEYLCWLKESPLETLDHGDRKIESVPLLLKPCLQQVSPAAIDVLAVTGLLSFAPFNRETIAAALPDIQLKQPLNELVRYGLLLKAGSAYTISHALVHTYVRKHHSAENTTIKNLSSYYSTFAREQRQQGLKGYERLDAQRAHIMRVLVLCEGSGNWRTLTDLVWAIDDYLDIRGYWTERKAALKVAVTAARKLKNRHDEGAFLGNLGLAYHSLGQVEEAIGYYEQALAITREIGDRRVEGNTLGNLGLAYHDLDEVEKAIGYYEQALAITREIGDRRVEGNDLDNLGLAYRNLGQVEKAIRYYKQALAITREIGDRRVEGNALGNLGLAYHDMGQVEKAIRYYEQALAITREIGDRRVEGNTLGNLGLAYHDLGQVEKAIEYHKQALAISQEIGNRRVEGNDLNNLGLAYRNLGQVEKAIKYYEQALAITREIGDRRVEGNALGNLGSVYNMLGRVGKAIEYYEQALAISCEIGDRDSEGGILGNLGNAYSNFGQVEKAIRYYKQALAISSKIGDRHGEGSILGNLGSAYRDLGQLEKAIGYHEQALAISRETGDRNGEGNDLGNLGNAYRDLGQLEKAIGYHEKALAISREIGDRRGEGSDLGNLGVAYRSLGQMEKAIGYYEQALAISREIGDRRGEGNDLGNLGNAYRDLGQLEKAIGYHEKALAISREIGDRRGEGTHLGDLGNAYRNLGQLERSIGYHEQALAIYKMIKSPNTGLAEKRLSKLRKMADK